IADTVHNGVVDDRSAVGVVDDGGVHIGDRRVVVILTAAPEPAHETYACVSESIVNPAIKTDVRSPIAAVPDVNTLTPAPISRRPQHADLRRLNPGPWDPVVAVRTIGPVAGCPDIARSRTNWLHINRQRWRTDADRNPYCDLRLGSHRQSQKGDADE